MKLFRLLTFLEGRSRLLFLILLIGICSILPFLISGNNIAAIITGLFIVVIVWLSSPIWRPKGYGKNRIRWFSLVVVASVAMPHKYWSEKLTVVLEKLNLPSWAEAILHLLPANSPSVAVMIFVLSAVFIINFFMRDKTVMKETNKRGIGKYTEKELRKELNNLKERLRRDLDEINDDTKWSSKNYEPLKAQVQIKNKMKQSRKLCDLLSAIKNNDESNVFLIIGDPGSGKSVALRKLAEDLLEEFDATGKLPLYLNLRDWQKRAEWNINKPPTTQQLEKFVIKDILKRVSVYEQDFLNQKIDDSDKTIFSELLSQGRFFLIFDSFDELPQVLDVDEASKLIDNLSSTIFKFITGGHNTRGVLSSRHYRKPSKKFVADTELIIRPFSEKQIFSNLNKSSAYDNEMVVKIFNKRPDLWPILHNPFMCSLLQLYSKKNPFILPSNQSELYENYLFERLKQCEDQIIEGQNALKEALTKDEVLRVAHWIAWELFENYGLEAPVERLVSSISKRYGKDHRLVRWSIDIIVYANIGRIGKGFEKRFSFVHRRFTEFFVAKTLLKNCNNLPFESIPHDSRWREALVLVAEVAPDNISKKIAEYCWSQLKIKPPYEHGSSGLNYSQFIHPLRFLKVAFRGRLQAISSFRREFGQLIVNTIKSNKDLLTKKHAVEATCLLKKKDMNKALINAFELNNEWISETATNSCRNFGTLEKSLESKLISYFSNLDHTIFMNRSWDIIFSLKLSDAFRKVKLWCRLRQLDGYCYSVIKTIIFVIDPILFILIYISTSLLSLLTEFMVSDDVIKKRQKDFQSSFSKKQIKVRYFLKKKKRRLKYAFYAVLLGHFKKNISFSLRKSIISKIYEEEKKSKASLSSELKTPFSTQHMLVFRMLLPLLGVILSDADKTFSLTSNSIGIEWFTNIGSIWHFLLFLLLPWFHIGRGIMFLTKLFFISIKESLFSIISYFTVSIIFIIPIFLLLYLPIFLLPSDTFATFFGIFGFIAFGFSLFPVGREIVRLAKKYYRDRNLYREARKEKIWTREIISIEFCSLKTSFYRTKYIKFLDFSRVEPKGRWPKNLLPNINNDYSSTYLAQLEERWLGFSGE